MLENLARKKSLTPTTTRCRPCAAFSGSAEGAAFESSRCAACAFFSAEKRVTKHPRDRVVSAQKMHLKAVGLFFCARPGIDAPDVRFGIGIGSSSHERLPNNYPKQGDNQ